MYLRICSLLCCAILIGFATEAQAGGARNSDLTFTDDADIEGSGIGEVTHDLESSGSGFGPDDEDALDTLPQKPIEFKPNEPVEPESKKTVVIPKLEGPSNEDEPIAPITTKSPDVVMNRKAEDRHTSFFAQPGILAAVIGGAVVGLLCAILVVMFIVYRMRKKDEGSYALGEPKQSPTTTSYSRGTSKEFYA